MGGRITGSRAFPERQGKLRRGLRSRELRGGGIVDAVQSEAAGMKAWCRLPVVDAFDRMTERMHRRSMLGDHDQHAQDKPLDQVRDADGIAGQRIKFLMKHSCSISWGG